jgi:hypothetical protein
LRRERLVLRGDEDAAEAGVDAVAQREIDNPVGAAEKNRRLCAVASQWVQPLAGTTGQQDNQRIVEHREPLISQRLEVVPVSFEGLTSLAMPSHNYAD